jgi:hypothetical protein
VLLLLLPLLIANIAALITPTAAPTPAGAPQCSYASESVRSVPPCAVSWVAASATCGWYTLVALPGLVAGTPHCIRVLTHGRWGGGRLGGAHTWHAQVHIKLGCLANAPVCMVGWVTHTSTLEQLILQDISLSLH